MKIINLRTVLESKPFKIMLAMMLIVAPISFVWHLEISMAFIPNMILTNGWFDADPVQVYHAKMYAMLFVNFLTAFLILINMGEKK